MTAHDRLREIEERVAGDDTMPWKIGNCEYDYPRERTNAFLARLEGENHA